MRFVGHRHHTKEDVHLLIYKNEIRVRIYLSSLLYVQSVTRCDCGNHCLQNWTHFHENQLDKVKRKKSFKQAAKDLGKLMMKLLLD